MTDSGKTNQAYVSGESFGFVRVAAAVPPVFVARPRRNAEQLIETAVEAGRQGVQVLLFHEMSLTGYTCGDLFNQLWLRQEALNGLALFLEKTRSIKMLSVLGMPLATDQQLFNVAVVACQGGILGIVPKAYIPGYKEFYEPRWFSPANNRLCFRPKRWPRLAEASACKCMSTPSRLCTELDITSTVRILPSMEMR